MNDLAVTGGLLLTDGAARPGNLYLEGGRIAAVTREALPARRTLAAAGRWVTPGLLDLHLNGAAGVDFTSLRLDDLPAFERHLLAGGTTAYLAALNTDRPGRRVAALRELRRALAERPAGAPRCLGFMLEGPHYSPAQCGAHDASLFCDPTPEAGAEVLAAAGEWLRVWSLAPERPGSVEFIRWLAGQGVVAAVGHSSASFDEVGAAVAAGARLVTHVYCCLDSFTGSGPSKRLGGNEAALAHDELTLELLADGQHLTPALVRWIVATAGWKRVCMIGGRAYRPDRTHFAGSTATLPLCLRNFQAATGLPSAMAAATATLVPARLLGLHPGRGSLAVGSVGDVVVWDPGWEVAAVVTAGQVCQEV
ncbi:MAG: amidohydrolase family protein [Armatimonadetes bacterium]|nr:amidohydrolase family protein [Armatimonadota bacterium]